MDRNRAAAAVCAFDSFLQSLARRDQKSGSFRGAAQWPNLVTGLHGDAYIQDTARSADKCLRNSYPFHDARSKNQEAVIGASAARGLELARRHSARHAAGLDEFIDSADMMRNLRSVSATTARAEFKEHRTLIGIAEFNVSHALRQSQGAHRVMAHVGHGRFLRRRELGRVLDTDVHAIGKQTI